MPLPYYHSLKVNTILASTVLDLFYLLRSFLYIIHVSTQHVQSFICLFEHMEYGYNDCFHVFQKILSTV